MKRPILRAWEITEWENGEFSFFESVHKCRMDIDIYLNFEFKLSCVSRKIFIFGFLLEIDFDVFGGRGECGISINWPLNTAIIDLILDER